MNSSTQWNVGLDPWIIFDGNYRNFYVGQVVEFALEIYPKTFTLSDKTTITTEPSETTTYKVNAQVVLAAPTVRVIDFGIRGYYSPRTSLPFDTESTFVAGEISLGVDPFFYYEEHNKLPGIPPLMYTWQIDGITLHRWPAIRTVNQEGQKLFLADKSKHISEQVTKTDAWNDGKKNSDYPIFHYTLHCTKLDVEPKFRKST